MLNHPQPNQVHRCYQRSSSPSSANQQRLEKLQPRHFVYCDDFISCLQNCIKILLRERIKTDISLIQVIKMDLILLIY